MIVSKETADDWMGPNVVHFYDVLNKIKWAGQTVKEVQDKLNRKCLFRNGVATTYEHIMGLNPNVDETEIPRSMYCKESDSIHTKIYIENHIHYNNTPCTLDVELDADGNVTDEDVKEVLWLGFSNYVDTLMELTSKLEWICYSDETYWDVREEFLNDKNRIEDGFTMADALFGFIKAFMDIKVEE